MRFRWMITVWIGRTSRWEEEISEEEEGMEDEMVLDEDDEEDEEMEEWEVREVKRGRRRNSNILLCFSPTDCWVTAGCTSRSATRTHVDLCTGPRGRRIPKYLQQYTSCIRF